VAVADVHGTHHRFGLDSNHNGQIQRHERHGLGVGFGQFVAKSWAARVVSTAFWAIYLGVLAYLSCLLFYLLATPFAMSNARLDDYLIHSFGFLVPFQLLLIGLFWLLYFKETPFFTPNAAIIGTYIHKKAATAAQTGHVQQQEAFAALTQDADLSNVLTLLRNHLPEDTSDIVLLQNQYTNWQRDKNLNLTAPDALQRQLNNLTLAITHYIEKL
jgi:hypothetical protein